MKLLHNQEIRKVSEMEEKNEKKEILSKKVLNEKNQLISTLQQLENQIKSDKKMYEIRLNDAIINVMEEQSKIKECSLAELRECSLKEISSYKDKIIYLESAVRLSEREVEAVRMYVTLVALYRILTFPSCTYSHFVSPFD